ncbi:MAG: NAD(P)-binding protein [Cyanobium sp.]
MSQRPDRRNLSNDPSIGASPSERQPFRVAILGAGVAGCTLAAELCRRGWDPKTIGLWEAGRGPGGRMATRRSRRNPNLRINHGASLFNIRTSPPPTVLTPLLEQGWVEPWRERVAVINAAADVLPHQGQDPLLEGNCYQGRPGMEQVCGGLLHLAGDNLCTTFNTLIRSLERDQDRWLLKNAEGAIVGESESLVLTGTLLAHPRSRLTFGWRTPPMQELAEQLQDPGLNHALAAISALRFESRSSLLIHLAPEEAAAWHALPFRLLVFEPASQQRWGLWRVCIQPQEDGSCAVVAHSNATFAAEHIGIYGSRSAIARQLGLTATTAQEQAVIDALSESLTDVLGHWLPPKPLAGGDRQLMRWGGAFPLQPALPVALNWIPSLRLGFCGDFLAGPGFARVEGAMQSAQLLASQLMP